MKKEKKIECHPIDGVLKNHFGEGYYYGITITSDYGEGEEEEERTDWYICQNGTFSSETDCWFSHEPSQHISCGGTFDSSKYNEYVKQMQEFKGDWEEELEYNDDLFFDSIEYEKELRRKMLTPLVSPEIDSSELPF